MAFRFGDGFDHYVTASITEKWNSISNTPLISSGTGRRGGQSVRSAGGGFTLSKTLDNQPSWVIGFAMRFTANATNPNNFLGVFDAGTLQCDVRSNPDGTLSVTRNGTALTGGTSTKSMNTNVYYFVEFKVTISTSIAANSCKVRVNGVDWITVATGQSTQATGNASANVIKIANAITTGTSLGILDFDDLYILDGNDSGISGNPCNDFLGDVAIVPLYANAAGSYTQWTPDSGVNYARVNETLADEDNSYVSTPTVGNIDSYIYQTLTGSPANVFAVLWNAEMRKTDVSSYNVSRHYRKSSTDYFSGTDQSISSNYLIFQEVLQSDPATSAKWLASALAGSEWGARLHSIV
jgi:hypothetical protein